jgi:flagellar basal body rod protein FlgG
MMDSAQRRVDVTAQNVANMATPAYRSRRIFAQVLDLRQALPCDVVELASGDAAALKATGNPLDIATDPGTVLKLRSGAGYEQTRAAQLHQNADGFLVDGEGRVLQAEGGGDLVANGGTPQILKDGTVLVAGQAVAKVGLFLESGEQDVLGATGRASANGGMHGARKTASVRGGDGGVVHTGMLVAADVDLGAQMVELTKASRLAETGARVFSVYDDLLGAASSKLGELAK